VAPIPTVAPVAPVAVPTADILPPVAPVAAPTPATLAPVVAPTAPSPVSIEWGQNFFTVATEGLDDSFVFADTNLFVPMWAGDIENPPNDVVCFVGEAFGLDSNITSFRVGGTDCTAENGCGVHVHSGFDCNDTVSQG
jgi:hypothetical protein